MSLDSKRVSRGRLHEVWHGDCLWASYPDAPPADLTFMDPPYNFGIDYGKGKKADRMSGPVYRQWLVDRLSVMVDRTRPGGAVCVLLPDEWAAYAFTFLDGRVKYRNWLKWHETFGVQTTDKFARCSRHLLYFERPGGRRTFNGDAVRVPSARLAVYGDKRADPRGKIPGDVWEFSRVAGTFKERVKGVPTQLPEALLTRLVLALTNPGGRVLEFCAGSGSLGVVAVRHGRHYEGWEAEGKTADLAAGRIRREELTPTAPGGIPESAG